MLQLFNGNDQVEKASCQARFFMPLIGCYQP